MYGQPAVLSAVDRAVDRARRNHAIYPVLGQGRMLTAVRTSHQAISTVIWPLTLCRRCVIT